MYENNKIFVHLGKNEILNMRIKLTKNVCSKYSDRS